MSEDANGWRPMSDEAKKADRVDLWDNRRKQRITGCHWNEREQLWDREMLSFYPESMTHWRLPPPPPSSVS